MDESDLKHMRVLAGVEDSRQEWKVSEDEDLGEDVLGFGVTLTSSKLVLPRKPASLGEILTLLMQTSNMINNWAAYVLRRKMGGAERSRIAARLLTGMSRKIADGVTDSADDMKRKPRRSGAAGPDEVDSILGF